MFLYETVEFHDFLDAFKRKGRETQFSYDAKRAIYEYLWNLAEETGEPIELDVIGICCDFAEYASVAELLEELFPDYVTEWEREALTINDVLELLEQETAVILFDVDIKGYGSIVIHQD